MDNRPGLLSSRKLKRGFSASLRALDLTDDMAIIKSWSFDVLEYEERALRSFAKSILGEFDLPQQCKLTEKAIQFFIRSVAHGYRDENPFHNYKHGMQVMHVSLACWVDTSSVVKQSGLTLLLSFPLLRKITGSLYDA